MHGFTDCNHLKSAINYLFSLIALGDSECVSTIVENNRSDIFLAELVLRILGYD
jgi:hypothetical protein